MKFNRKQLPALITVILAITLMVLNSACSDDDDNSATGFERDSNYVYILDDTIDVGDTLTLEANVAYLCTGFVYVESSAVLNIDAGAVIKFAEGEGANASALIICRGGKIYAEGTADNPIIMTAKADSIGDPSDMSLFSNSNWGGLIVLGYAPTNRSSEGYIEGIPDEPRTVYGGDDENDDSGVIRYVSIRHGGSNIGSGNEINGLTLGAVGAGTTIEYVEIYSNLDDGVEFFGGTVNTSHIAVAFCGDDGFDYDEGFRGNGQYWFVIQLEDNGGHAGEHDGGTEPETGTPYARPVISNATYIGSGASSSNIDNDPAIKMRDNAGGEYHNSIFYDFYGSGLAIEDLSDDVSTVDSRARLEAGDIVYQHNIWYSFGVGNTADVIWDEDYTRDYITTEANDNQIVDPGILGVTRTDDGGLDPRPTASAATSGATQPSDSFFESVSYKGAFDPNTTPWIAGWTALDEYGILQ